MYTAPTVLRRRARGTRAGWYDNRRGATAVVIVLCAVPLFGLLAVAVDLGMLYRSRRNSQTAADAAALAYAYEIYRGKTTTVATAALTAEATANGYTNGSNHASVSYDNTITSWNGTGAPAIKVTVQDTNSAFFAGFVGRNKTTVTATATATWSLAPSTGCMMALSTTASPALDTQGNPTVLAPGCGVVVNSSASPAATTGGSATISAGSIAVTGGTSGNGFTPTPNTGVPPSPNPLAAVTMPSMPTTCTYSGSSLTINNNQSPTFSPPSGQTKAVICGNLNVKNGGFVTFSPGMYFLLGGIEVKGAIGGTGVTFINTSGTIAGTNYAIGAIDITAGGAVNLSAETSNAGSLNGILFYQAVALPVAKIWANAGGTLSGTFYFPTGELSLGGGGSATVNGSVIANTIEMGGNSGLTINAPSATNGAYFAAKRVTLVD